MDFFTEQILTDLLILIIFGIPTFIVLIKSQITTAKCIEFKCVGYKKNKYRGIYERIDTLEKYQIETKIKPKVGKTYKIFVAKDKYQNKNPYERKGILYQMLSDFIIIPIIFVFSIIDILFKIFS